MERFGRSFLKFPTLLNRTKLNQVAQPVRRIFTGHIYRRWLFYVWLASFYTVWLAIVQFGGHWDTIREHWGIALSMLFGSYIAGSTPMGGGTVGFPVLVLLFDMPASMGRNFGLAVQSIGMVSASIYILSHGVRVDWRLLRPALLGGFVGVTLGACFVAPFVSDLTIKLLFAVVWASFGVLHLMKIKEFVSRHGEAGSWMALDRWIGLAVGIGGGIVASITGVGIDMILYATLVLLYRADLKIAIPTSVLIMAFTSVVGTAINLLLNRIAPQTYLYSPDVFGNWIAAAPVVAFGAPLGALVVNLISRTPTLVLVSLLCIGQFVWTIYEESVSGLPLILAVGGVVVVNVIFLMLYQLGSRCHQPSPEA